MVSAVLGISKHELPVRLGDVFDFLLLGPRTLNGPKP